MHLYIHSLHTVPIDGLAMLGVLVQVHFSYNYTEILEWVRGSYIFLLNLFKAAVLLGICFSLERESLRAIHTKNNAKSVIDCELMPKKR